jgi:hypothetical protein
MKLIPETMSLAISDIRVGDRRRQLDFERVKAAVAAICTKNVDSSPELTPTRPPCADNATIAPEVGSARKRHQPCPHGSRL